MELLLSTTDPDVLAGGSGAATERVHDAQPVLGSVEVDRRQTAEGRGAGRQQRGH